MRPVVGRRAESSARDSIDHVEISDLRVEDVGTAYVRWLNDPEVMRYTEARFATHNLDTVRAYVEKTNASASEHIWRILADGRHVGNIKLSGINPQHGRASVAILVGDRSVWGQGVAARAIEKVTAAGFSNYALQKLTAGIYSGNLASVRAFENAGYGIEATLRSHRCFEGRMIDEILMARFKSPAN